MNSSIGNSGLLITRTLHRHKHQQRNFFNRHGLLTTVTEKIILQVYSSILSGRVKLALLSRTRGSLCLPEWPMLSMEEVITEIVGFRCRFMARSAT
jgi:hypothetical protein